MEQYYIEQYNFYLSYTVKQSEYERCGFDEYPHQEYDTIVMAIEKLNIIKNTLKITDIGCGNGLLLRHIWAHIRKRIIPFGVDFLHSSIIEAQNKILPQFSSNFSCSFLMDYKLQYYSDVILLDPSIIKECDRAKFFKRIKNAHISFCILYTYSDVLQNLNLTSVKDLTDSYIPFSYNTLFTIDNSNISLSAIVL